MEIHREASTVVQGFWGRLIGITKSTLRKTLRKELVTEKQLRTWKQHSTSLPKAAAAESLPEAVNAVDVYRYSQRH